MKRALLLTSGLLAVACSPQKGDGRIERMTREAAARSGVPDDLVLAIAGVEGGLRLAPARVIERDEVVPVAGVMELRHGRFDSLRRGAELTGKTELELEQDLALGTDAGARVLDEMARARALDRADLGAWADALEELSGHLERGARADYRARVFTLLKYGGALRASGGETIALPAHDEIPLALTLAPPPERAQDTPEFAGATWFTTPQNNKWTPGRGGNPITMIAIHDTEGGWDASVATLQNDGGKSVHYIVDADGSRVGQFVHEADTAWHVGNWFYNQHMVGIEHVGYASKDEYQTAMYQTSAKLVDDIAKRQNLGPQKNGTHLDRATIVGHQEVPDGNAIPEDSPPCSDSPGTCVKSPNYGGANNHRDPGVYWEWCQYMEIVGSGSSCKCNDAFDLYNCVHDGSEMVRCQNGKIDIVHCPGGCKVNANGVNDECIPPPGTSSSSGAGGGGGVTVGATSSSSSGAVAASSSSTSSGRQTSSSTGAGGGNGDAPLKGNGCSCETTGGEPASGRFALLALALGAAIARRRNRSA